MRFCTFLAALLLSAVLFSQPYSPLLEPGKTWDAFYIVAGSPTGYESGLRYYLDGDSTVDGANYRQLWGRFFLTIQWPYNPPFQLSDPRRIGLIREDTALRRISYRAFLPGSPVPEPEKLLYDFSLAPGDSLETYPGYWMVLDSIGMTALETGEQRRIFHFSPTTGWNCAYYIEGIGGGGDIADPLFCIFENGYQMVCVKQDGAPIWANPLALWGEQACSIALPVNTAKPVRLYAFPNPATETLRISTGNIPYEQICLYDTRGKLWLQQSVPASNPFSLPLNGLPDGVYHGLLSGKAGPAVFRFLKFNPRH